MRYLKMILAAVAVTLVTACSSLGITPDHQIISRVKPHTVTVRHAFGLGSGVWVGEDLVMTAKHVIQNYDGFPIQDPFIVIDDQGKFHSGTVIIMGEGVPPALEADWAYIRVKGVKRTTWAKPYCGELYAGERVIGFGNGHGTTGHLPYLGRIQAPWYVPHPVYRESFWRDSFLTNMDGAPGVSGGPVFNMDGSLIGMMVGAFNDRQAGTFQQISYPVRDIDVLCGFSK